MEFICYYLIACGVFIANKDSSTFERLLLAVFWPVMLGCLLYAELYKRN